MSGTTTPLPGPPRRDGVVRERAAHGLDRHSAQRERDRAGEAARRAPCRLHVHGGLLESPVARPRNVPDRRPRRRRDRRPGPPRVELRRVRGTDDRRDPHGDPRLDDLDGHDHPAASPSRTSAARADRVLARVLEVDGDVAIFGHGHALRILAARWLGLEPTAGALFELSTATISRLGWERERRVIELWNGAAHLGIV